MDYGISPGLYAGLAYKGVEKDLEKSISTGILLQLRSVNCCVFANDAYSWDKDEKVREERDIVIWQEKPHMYHWPRRDIFPI